MGAKAKNIFFSYIMALKSFFVLFFCFVIIDYVVISYNKGMWYDLVSRVSPMLAPTAAGKSQILYALVAWFLLVLGLFVLVVNRLHSLTDCIVWGIFYGLVVYGVFNFTNMSLFPEVYPWDLAWRDIFSGIISCSLSLLAFYSLSVEK